MTRSAAVSLELASLATRGLPLADFERAVLRCLQEVVGFEVGFFVRDAGVSAGYVGLDDAVVHRTRKHFDAYGRELSPVFAVSQRRQLAVDREVLGQRLERTRLYREFIEPHHGRCTLLAPLSFRGRALGVLALGRTRGRFRGAELEEIRPLLPTLCVCDASQPREASVPATLTTAERDVLEFLCLGYTNGEIARARGVSVNTVRNQLQSLYAKLGASTRAEAVALALEKRSSP